MLGRNPLQKGQQRSISHSLKLNIMDSYFARVQQQFDEKFVNDLFQLSTIQSQLQRLIASHSVNLLLSSQEVAKVFLVKLLSYPKLQHIAHQFIKNVITLKITLHNRSFELFIIQNLPSYLNFAQFQNPQTLNSVITYLALRIRSFNLSIRLTALKALKFLGNDLHQKQKYWHPVLQALVPTMIQKQKLVRQVSYTKGLFLHILQDQFNETRKVCIQALILFRRYFKPEDLKLIIVYMLNDEHEVVREEALIATKYLTQQALGKQDLQTIMMCLRQRISNMRKLVYQTLSMAIVNQPSLLLLIVQKTLLTLQSYKSDKKHIYRMLAKLGKRYSGWVQGLIQKLSLIDSVEPNWKNVIYKGKMIFCYEWWKSINQNYNLPFYFNKHMLYISDIQAYLFVQKDGIQEENNLINPSQLSKNHLIRFIQCQQDLSQDFHKAILQVIKETITGITDHIKQISTLEQLQLEYNLKAEELLINKQLIDIIKKHEINNSFNEIVQILKKCIKNRQKYQNNDSQIMKNKCSISKVEPNIIICNKSKRFQEKIYLKCLKHHLISSAPKYEYKRLIQCQSIREDEDYSYWSISIGRYSRIQCIMLLADSTERILDSYQVDYRQ